ncbi:peptidase M50B-like-domain-containing protein [Rhizoctonia solani]|nr:peptidase M50B-like-domain-containing protein [Rhizoctonia solani]
MSLPTITRPPIASATGEPHPPIFRPTQEQAVVIYASVVFIVVISALWHIPGARTLINPLKLFTIGWHELSHMAAAIFTGGRITSISIDPNTGGCTRVEGGHPPTILAAGYLGSTLIGAGLVVASWDTLAAKIASFPVAIGLAVPLILVRDVFTIVLIVIYEALLIGFWFINHGDGLRYYCLFLGIMSIFFVVWDFTDDRFFKKLNDSDATQFSLLYPKVPPHYWATGWLVFSSLMFIGMLLLGIAVFKRTPDEMAEEAAIFLPTR